ncbi:hypothetical protein U9M48_024832 [Paspalum notatum var. saurae]|uniref:Uncharacterized protein n=1 Tax=Paspalum notatum var. saurae TaxID=547442 RepID=A0AAQ3TN34_PASNO
MTPKSIKHGTYRVDHPGDDEDLKVNKESLEDVRMQAIQNIRAYQEETRRWKCKKLRPRTIKSRDLVLKKRTENKSKLSSKWEGPFVAVEASKGAYRLSTVDGEELPHTWNIYMLRRYYV